MTNPYRILIVDDIAENIQTIARHFEEIHPNYLLFQATSGKVALELAGTMKIDLVISDWEMPGMSGIELTKALKADPGTAHIPVIIITGVMLSSTDLDQALAAGANDYLRKPVDKIELTARTNAAIHLVKLHLAQIAEKNLELTGRTMLLARINQFNSSMANRLKKLEAVLPENTEALTIIRSLIANIDQNSRECNWKHFEKAFRQVYPEFSSNLLRAFPCITPAELRHCILIRLGLSNKDMASVLFQTADSIKVSRSRIRKKLGITNELNLQSFLITI